MEANTWQLVPGSDRVEIFPIISKPSILSSNCYLLSAPNALIIIDPGANPTQTAIINEVLNEAWAAKPRPVLSFLTHCHQDHSQELGSIALSEGIEIKHFAHEAGVDALARGDKQLSVAYLYPWEPAVCDAPFAGCLFDARHWKEPKIISYASGETFELRGKLLNLPNGTLLKQQSISLGEGEMLEIYHTPGHTPCSISLRVGRVLLSGDISFAANPGLCGLDGWSHADLMDTLGKVDWLLQQHDIEVCCTGHGFCVPAPQMQQKLRQVEEDARGLVEVDSLNADRIRSLKLYVDELLEEMSVLFTILSGRLYTASFYLSELEEEDAAQEILNQSDLDKIDRILSEFRRFIEAFNASETPELTVVLKGVQVAGSLQNLLDGSVLSDLLDASLVARARRLLTDYLGAVRGLKFVNTETSGNVHELLKNLQQRAQVLADRAAQDLLESADSEQSFISALARRLSSQSPLRHAQLSLVTEAQSGDIAFSIERLDDILSNLIESMIARGARHIQIRTESLADHILISLSAQPAVAPTSFSPRRLSLYCRMLGWLSGSLEWVEVDGGTEFLLYVPTQMAKL